MLQADVTLEREEINMWDKPILFATKQPIPTKELYEKIKDVQFSVGTPEYCEMGLLSHIRLPGYGRYFIHIMSGDFGIRLSIKDDVKQTGTFVANQILQNKIGIFARAFDEDRKPAMELLNRVAGELKGYLGL